jgi:site-specific recombinase XerD
LRERKDGRWEGKVITGYDTSGKPVPKWFYGKTQKDVQAKMAPFIQDVLQFGYTGGAINRERNFKELFMVWFETFVVINYQSTTIENRRRMIENHIMPAFEKYDVQDIDDLKLQRFIKKMREKFSRDYVQKMRDQLKNFFAYCTRKGIVKQNPALDIKIPVDAQVKPTNLLDGEDTEEVPDNKEKMALSQTMRAFILGAIELPGSERLKPMVYTAMFTGIRPQELIALKNENIDLDKGMLYVRRAMNRISIFDDNNNVVKRTMQRGKTKTEKSVRDIPIPPGTIVILREWYAYREVHGIKSDFLFPNEKTGAMRTYSSLRCKLERFIKRHKLNDEEITWYTFRHTFATMLFERDTHPKKVSALLGHAKISTTLDIYSHVLSTDIFDGTLEVLDDILSELTTKKNPPDYAQSDG